MAVTRCDDLTVRRHLCGGADAWKEDSDLGQQLEAMQELFGDALLPWVPFMPGAAVFI